MAVLDTDVWLFACNVQEISTTLIANNLIMFIFFWPHPNPTPIEGKQEILALIDVYLYCTKCNTGFELLFKYYYC